MTILEIVSGKVTVHYENCSDTKDVIFDFFPEGAYLFYTVTLIGSYMYVCVGSTLKKTRSPEDWMPRPPERYVL